MAESKKPLTPVKPAGMELIFLYPCPHCNREVPLIAPSRPAMAQCDACRENFPIVPVDDRTIRYMKTNLAGGKAAIDPDFLKKSFGIDFQTGRLMVHLCIMSCRFFLCKYLDFFRKSANILK